MWTTLTVLERIRSKNIVVWVELWVMSPFTTKVKEASRSFSSYMRNNRRHVSHNGWKAKWQIDRAVWFQFGSHLHFAALCSEYLNMDYNDPLQQYMNDEMVHLQLAAILIFISKSKVVKRILAFFKNSLFFVLLCP